MPCSPARNTWFGRRGESGLLWDAGSNPQQALRKSSSLRYAVPFQINSADSILAGPTPVLNTAMWIFATPFVVLMPKLYERNGQEFAATRRALASAIFSMVRPCRMATPSETTDTNSAEKATVMSTHLWPVVCAWEWACVSTSRLMLSAPVSGSAIDLSPPRAEPIIANHRLRQIG